jgi:hypothetical protein
MGVQLEPGRAAEGDEVGDGVARKGRARRFREARELKQGFDDGLFSEGSGTLADVDDDSKDTDDDEGWDDDDQHDDSWDEDDPLKIDERRNAS